MSVLNDFELQFEEHVQTISRPKAKLRFMVFDWLFSDIDITKGK